MIPAEFWKGARPNDNSRVYVGSSCGKVIITVESAGDERYELNLDTNAARQFIFRIHRAIMESLQDGSSSGLGGGV